MRHAFRSICHLNELAENGKSLKLKLGTITTCDVSHLPTYKNSLVLCATALVVARAFSTSESSEAHYLLFSRIFEIAQRDTGLEVTFHYISERGIQSIVADGHRGQALGR